MGQVKVTKPFNILQHICSHVEHGHLTVKLYVRITSGTHCELKGFCHITTRVGWVAVSDPWKATDELIFCNSEFFKVVEFVLTKARKSEKHFLKGISYST